MRINSLDKALKRKLIFWETFIIGFFVLFIGASSIYLYDNKRGDEYDWNNYLTESCDYTQEEINLMENAAEVSVGTYIVSIDEIDIKNSNYTVTFNCWFNWEGNDTLDMRDKFDIYEGEIKSVKILDEYRNGADNYQLFRVNATVHKEYDTRRFPLASYQLRLYIMPTQSIEDIVFAPDKDGSSVNENLGVTGFKLTNSDVGLYINRHDTALDGAYYKNGASEVYSEIITEIELNRSSWGLYIKCILTLLGTTAWMFITLFACSHHNVDSLGMIPAVLIGTASNIVIGANLVPDALQAGLLEFINIWGIYIVIISTIMIMQINQIRREYGKDSNLFGEIIFYTIVITTIAGYIILPLSAYKF